MSAPINRPTPEPVQQLPLRQLSNPLESQSHPPLRQQQPRPVQPWSVYRPNLLPPTLSKGTPPSGPSLSPSPSPFPRSSYVLSATASDAGELFLFGGTAQNSLRNDLYVFSTRDFSATLLKPTGEAPSPRYGHAGARIGDTLLIWGGTTSRDPRWTIGLCDSSFHLLNLVSRQWSRVVVNGPGPVSRDHHAATVVGSKLFVFGGRNGVKVLNDMWALDLKFLKSKPVWVSYEPTKHYFATGCEKPPPRHGHVLVTTGDHIILFGGVINESYYNDTWSFDVSTRKWTKLKCTGHTPSPRDGHAAALVDDVIYVFGGHSNRAIVDDLLAFKLSTQRWFLLQNIEPSPSGRWRHAVASDGTRVFVFGGRDSGIARDESALIHVLDTEHIVFPNPDPNAVKPSEEITKLARKSSASTPTQGEDNDREGSAEYREKSAVPDASFEEEVEQLELERQPSATLAALTERDQRLAQLVREHADRLLAQTSLVEQKDAELVVMQARLDELLPSRRSRDQQVRALEQALQEATSRAAEAEERSRRAHEQITLVEQKDAELKDLRAKLDELLLSRHSRDQQVYALDQALQKATSRVAEVDELSRRACEKIGRCETELAAVRLRLTDAENGLAESKAEADTLRVLYTACFVSTNEDRTTREPVERIRVMDADSASLRFSEKDSEAMESRNEG